MADQARGERMIRIFVYMMAHYNNRYSVADIMRHLDIREEDLRSVQRDMHALSEIEGGYIKRSVESGKTYYQVALERANKLIFPEFGDTLLHFMFLQRIANIYPATSNLIEDLTKRITQDLPIKEQSTLAHYAKELNGRILFMGTPPSVDENVGKNLPVILFAQVWNHPCRYTQSNCTHRHLSLTALQGHLTIAQTTFQFYSATFKICREVFKGVHS